MQYYGKHYRSLLHPLLQRINAYLVRWLRRKYRRFRGFKKAMACWQGITTRCPRGQARPASARTSLITYRACAARGLFVSW